MKSTAFKNLPFAFITASIIIAITSCNKAKLTPEKLTNSSSSSSIIAPAPYAYAPTIYGVQSGGTGGHNLYTIDINTGLPLTTSAITFVGGGGISHGSILGIAKTPGLSTGYLTMTSVCGGTSQFYSFNFSTKVAVALGSIFGSGYISDIECHPVTKAVYGIKENLLVKILTFGSMCDGTPTGNVPATYEVVGNLASVGSGPYSISFNYLGDCAIMSAKDHNRAYVVLPATNYASTLSAFPSVGISGVIVKALPAANDLTYCTETASCISGLTQYVGIRGGNSLATSGDFIFYKWVNLTPTTYGYQPMAGPIYGIMADYTSETGTGIIKEPK